VLPRHAAVAYLFLVRSHADDAFKICRMPFSLAITASIFLAHASVPVSPPPTRPCMTCSFYGGFGPRPQNTVRPRHPSLEAMFRQEKPGQSA
jgi:hypothetical protein